MPLIGPKHRCWAGDKMCEHFYRQSPPDCNSACRISHEPMADWVKERPSFCPFNMTSDKNVKRLIDLAINHQDKRPKIQVEILY